MAAVLTTVVKGPQSIRPSMAETPRRPAGFNFTSTQVAQSPAIESPAIQLSDAGRRVAKVELADRTNKPMALGNLKPCRHPSGHRRTVHRVSI